MSENDVNITQDQDDTEGHVRLASTGEAGEVPVEGGRGKLPFRALVQGAEDDTEGHRMALAVPETDNADEDDSEGHRSAQ